VQQMTIGCSSGDRVVSNSKPKNQSKQSNQETGKPLSCGNASGRDRNAPKTAMSANTRKRQRQARDLRLCPANYVDYLNIVN
jgi:hypothetical protein